jgi:hypothetical protein
VKWHDLYGAMAKPLVKRGVIHDETLTPADDAALEEIAKVLPGGKSFAPAQIGGLYVLPPPSLLFSLVIS